MSGVPVFTLIMDFHDGGRASIVRTTFADIKKELANYIFTNVDSSVKDQVSSRTSAVRDWSITRSTDTNVVSMQ